MAAWISKSQSAGSSGAGVTECGAVVRWCIGAVVQWSGGALVRWSGCGTASGEAEVGDNLAVIMLH